MIGKKGQAFLLTDHFLQKKLHWLLKRQDLLILLIFVEFVLKFLERLNEYSYMGTNTDINKSDDTVFANVLAVQANPLHFNKLYTPSAIPLLHLTAQVFTWVSGSTEATQSKSPHFLSVLRPKRFSMLPGAVKCRVARGGQRWMSKKRPKRRFRDRRRAWRGLVLSGAVGLIGHES